MTSLTADLNHMTIGADPAADQTPLFRLQDVSLRGEQRPRLERVSLSIPAGTTALIGYSGAGKTSLLNLLAGFEQPDSGTLVGPGRTRTVGPPGRPHSGSDRAPRLPLFWAPQNGGLWPHLSVLQHLTAVSPNSLRRTAAIPTDVHRNSAPRNSEKSADEILQALDLDHRRQALPGALSQGERARLAVARALASRAQILLLDEPLAHVDLARRSRFWDFIRNEVAVSCASLIFASHDPEVVIRESTAVICLDQGRVIFQGATSRLYRHPPDRISAEFLGPVNWFEPHTASVWLCLASGRQPDDALAAEADTIPDNSPDNSRTGSVAIRPEWLELQRDPAGPLEVVSSVSSGVLTATVVRHRELGQQRLLRHCSSSRRLHPGDLVRAVPR